ncbi:MAG TPA: flavin reductase family protein [Dehalococcoidales bacterium]|nr:flavin reductase family protein [Dehalococcoidales bacterium]
MAKIQIAPDSVMSVNPVVLAGSVVNGKPTFMAVAWCSVADMSPPMIVIAIHPSRYTMKGIEANKEFSINTPSVDLVKEADYCGLISGSRIDKTAVCGFKVFYGKLKAAPLIEQCPVNVACKLEKIVNLGSHSLVIGRVEETYLNDDCVIEGEVAVRKINPIIFADGQPPEYCALGKNVGSPFEIGNALKKK